MPGKRRFTIHPGIQGIPGLLPSLLIPAAPHPRAEMPASPAAPYPSAETPASPAAKVSEQSGRGLNGHLKAIKARLKEKAWFATS